MVMVIHVTLSISLLMPCWSIFEVLDSISCSQPEEDILTRRYLYFSHLMIWCVLQTFKETQHNIAKLKMVKSACILDLWMFCCFSFETTQTKYFPGSCSWSDCASTSCSCSSFSPLAPHTILRSPILTHNSNSIQLFYYRENPYTKVIFMLQSTISIVLLNVKVVMIIVK